jgi:hypothetical protein
MQAASKMHAASKTVVLSDFLPQLSWNDSSVPEHPFAVAA